MKTPTLKLVAVGVLLAGCVFAALAQRSNSSAVGAAAPDDGLPVKKVKSWSYAIQPSPTPLTLRQRAPTVPEQQVIDRVRQLLANRPAKAFALLDGDAVIYSETKSPTDAETLIFGYSVGKTVTAMAVGQAICANKLKLYTKASELVPELTGKALGAATVHDLLRMASGAADPNPDSTVWTYEQFIEWQYGNLSLADLVSSDRVAKAQRGLFFDYKPGEHFSYKSTDPILLGIMVSRATNTVWGQWIQERVLNPMGAAHPAQYAQDYQQNGLADGGLYMRLDDWIRFAVLVKRSSQEKGCFGDFVRKAMATQIRNAGNPDTRKFGRLFDGYGYLIWTENQMVPNTAWAVGWGGQRISWSTDPSNNRMVITFSDIENWMPEVYEVARDWNSLQSTQTLNRPAVQLNQPVDTDWTSAPSDMTHEQRTIEILQELTGGKQKD